MPNSSWVYEPVGHLDLVQVQHNVAGRTLRVLDPEVAVDLVGIGRVLVPYVRDARQLVAVSHAIVQRPTREP